MFCSQCGKEIDNNAAFCGYCGSAQQTVQVSVTEKKKPVTRWIILAVVSVLVVIIGIIITIGILKQSKETKQGEEASAEQSVDVEPWKEAYCDFLIVINSENVDLIHEQYAYMEDAINQFYNENYNVSGQEVSNRLTVPEELLFSLINMDEDEIPELVLTGDYGGMILTFVEDKIQPITSKSDDFEINNEIYETYSITNENLADILMYEEARTKDMNRALVSSTDEIVDMGSMFMENMSDKEIIRERISSLTDIRYEEEQEMAAIVGYCDDVEVYREEGDNYIVYNNMRIQNLELLGIYPGMPLWKAVRLLENAGFYYLRWDDYITYVTGEDCQDWGVELQVDNDNRITGIGLYCIE